ncbi:MAG: SGNH/GDSL hydrolase family protein [Candidatus Omnitrophica bacterium]|nr:SGNH/GDSL hydrolase family protein [Candidatus Omnitrophota bacterium]
MTARTIIGFIVIPLLVGGMFVVARQVIIIGQSVKRGNYHQKPYQRTLAHPELRFLFLGDSTAVGTGAKTSQGSTAGYFASDFPEAQIVNRGRNGKRLHELVGELDQMPTDHYDLVVLQIGANDIVHLTPYHEIENELGKLLASVKAVGNHIVILHCGNMGAAPILRWPFTWIMTQRSRDVRQIYIRQARQHGAVYVDLFTERKDDLFLTNVPNYYSPDYFHPNENGYRYWYQQIRKSLDQAMVRLRN